MASKGPIMLRGSCACGSVTVNSSTVPTEAVSCHCTTCRKTSGAAYMAFARFPNKALDWNFGSTTASVERREGKARNSRNNIDDVSEDGHEQIVVKDEVVSEYHHSAIASRGHCKRCGTPLWMRYHCRPDATYLPLGLVDEDSIVGEMPRPTAHIFVAEKVSWLPLPEDGSKRSDRFNRSFVDLLEQWKISTATQ